MFMCQVKKSRLHNSIFIVKICHVFTSLKIFEIASRTSDKIDFSLFQRDDYG